MIKSEKNETNTKSFFESDDLSKCNGTTLFFLSIEEIILSILYLLDALRGNFSPILIILLLITCIATNIFGWTSFKRKSNNPYIKHLASYGFAIFYTIVFIGGHNITAFAYVIPMLIAITVYDDLKYAIKINVCVIIENIFFCFYSFFNSKYNISNVSDVILPLIIITLTCLCSIYISKVNIYINTSKLKNINEEKNEISNILKKVLEKSNLISQKVNDITGKVSLLEASSIDTKNSMSEVTLGSNNTAEAVQNQLIKTDEIQEHIKTVKDASETINSNVQESEILISEGQNSVDNLIDYGNISNTSSTQVKSELTKLNEYTNKMNSIVEIINNVADETSLLSLNASIEAARAGEAGKGFSVVASEISSLANQTQNATQNIGDLIQSITNEISVVIQTINTLLENNKLQNDYALNTAENFKKISLNSSNIESLCIKLNKDIAILDRANITITDNIQTISAVTEEVSAHSENTYNTSIKNVNIVNDVKVLIDSLLEATNDLKSIEKH